MVRYCSFAAQKVSLVATVLVVAFLVSGCDQVGKRHQAAGRVLRNGTPILGKKGSVVFRPDQGKGNKSPFEAVGTIETDGTFALFTVGKAGAPAGWYKVIVTMGEPGQEGIHNKTVAGKKSKTTLVIPARYADEAKSGLSKEIVAEPAAGAYDLDLK